MQHRWLALGPHRNWMYSLASSVLHYINTEASETTKLLVATGLVLIHLQMKPIIREHSTTVQQSDNRQPIYNSSDQDQPK